MERKENIDDLIDIYRNEDNFIIESFPSNKRNICCVFFSSLGIYAHNDVVGLKTVHDVDKYEWKSLCKSNLISKYYKKIIFIRDIKKLFYLEGISKKIDSINKLGLFLSKETKGMDVYLVGSSAGGYAAYILSNYLKNIKRIYSIGGVVDLKEHSTYLEYKENIQSTSATEIIQTINNNSIVLHFCGSKNQESINGIGIIQTVVSKNKLTIIPLKSTEHAPRPSGEDLIKLLTCSDKHLKRIKRKMRNKTEVGYFQFSIINLGIIKATINRIKKSIIKIIKNEKEF